MKDKISYGATVNVYKRDIIEALRVLDKLAKDVDVSFAPQIEDIMLAKSIIENVNFPSYERWKEENGQ
jgi:hypothetical protein